MSWVFEYRNVFGGVAYQTAPPDYTFRFKNSITSTNNEIYISRRDNSGGSGGIWVLYQTLQTVTQGNNTEFYIQINPFPTEIGSTAYAIWRCTEVIENSQYDPSNTYVTYGKFVVELVDSATNFSLYNTSDYLLSFSPVASSIQGSTGPQGTGGSQGGDGAYASIGLQGIPGTQGKDGTQGRQGFTGAPSTIAGPQGRQGNDGTQGTDGAYASIGNQGIQGLPGAQGGVGSFGIFYEFESGAASSALQGELRFSSTSNFQASSSFFYVYVNWIDADGLNHNSSSLTTASNTILAITHGAGVDYLFIDSTLSYSNGYVRHRVKYSHGYHRDQGYNSWQYATGDILGLVYNQATQGVQGGPGVQGFDGTPGAQGTDGAFASIGNQGIDGTQGRQGTDGRQGILGLQGFIGPQGRQGRQGYDGKQGVDGAYASIGLQGLLGLQGRQGILGLQGFIGPQGRQGNDGRQGFDGRQGTTGTQGIDGQSYNQGADGTQGVDGTQGTIGETGRFGLEFYFNGTSIPASGTPGSLAFSSLNIPTVSYVYNFYISKTDNNGDVLTNALSYRSNTTIALTHANGVDYLDVTSISNSTYYIQHGFRYIGGWHQDNGYTTWQFSTNEIIGVVHAQATQGVQGNSGTQGSDGISVQGSDGAYASIGLQGVQGATAGGSTWGGSWDARTDLSGSSFTTSNSNFFTRQFAYDNNSYFGVSKIIIGKTSKNNADLLLFYQKIQTAIGNGEIWYLKHVYASPATYSYARSASFEITGVTFGGGSQQNTWAMFDVSDVFVDASSVTAYFNPVGYSYTNHEHYFEFYPIGVAGQDGAQGIQGHDGAYAGIGIQGIQGGPGVQGGLGPQGVSGASTGMEFQYITNVSVSNLLTGQFQFNTAYPPTTSGVNYIFRAAETDIVGRQMTNYTYTGAGYSVSLTHSQGIDYFILYTSLSPGSSSTNYTTYYVRYIGGWHRDNGHTAWQIPNLSTVYVTMNPSAQGSIGIQGTRGPQGTQGEDGAYASIGFQGFQGSDGTQGPEGQGFQGTQGPAGGGGGTAAGDLDSVLSTGNSSTYGASVAYLNEYETSTTKVIRSVYGMNDRYQTYYSNWTNYPYGMDSAGANLLGSLPYVNNSYRVMSGGFTSTNWNYEYLARIAMGLDSFEGTRYNSDMDLIASGGNGGYHSEKGQRRILTPSGDGIGYVGDVNQYNRSYHYAIIGSQILPVRNPTGSNVLMNIKWEYSSQYGDTGGARVFIISPNNSSGTAYSTVNSVSYTSLAYYGQYSDSNATFSNTNYYVPAGKTILVCLINTFRSYTSYQAWGVNRFYDIKNTFNSNLICDLRMVNTLANAPFVEMGFNRNTVGEIYKVWNYCGTLHGDR
jgi:hypothetical protein